MLAQVLVVRVISASFFGFNDDAPIADIDAIESAMEREGVGAVRFLFSLKLWSVCSTLKFYVTAT